MTARQATPAEIIKSFTSDDRTVRISRQGRVEFRRGGSGPWLEGRFVSDYRVDDDARDRAYLTVRLT